MHKRKVDDRTGILGIGHTVIGAYSEEPSTTLQRDGEYVEGESEGSLCFVPFPFLSHARLHAHDWRLFSYMMSLLMIMRVSCSRNHVDQRRIKCAHGPEEVPGWTVEESRAGLAILVAGFRRQDYPMPCIIMGSPFVRLIALVGNLTTTPLGRSPMVRHCSCSLVVGGQCKVARLDRWDIQVVSRQVNLGKEGEEQWLRTRKIERDSNRPGTTRC